MLRKILFAVGAILFLGSATIAVNYQIWSSQKYKELASGSKIVETDVGPIEYVLKGQSGPVLLFLHGTPGGYDQAPKEDPDFISITPSRPGYLGTPLQVGQTPAEQANAYVALLDELDIDSVIVVGASGGGPSAITFAAMFPERTTALIAIEAVSRSESLQSLPGFMSSDFLVWLMLSAVNLLPDEKVIGIMIPDPKNQQLALQNPDKIEAIKSVMWSLWPPSLRDPGTQNDFLQFSKLSLPIDKITAPTLVIHGTADTNVHFSHGELLADTIPEAVFHVIEGGDHMMPFTHEEEVQEVIDGFISSVIGGSLSSD